MNGWVDGWRDELMNDGRWMDGWVGGWMDGGWIDGRSLPVQHQDWRV